jgi:catechol 2,3-dioxygenase
VTERWRDVAHVGHAELLTSRPEASLEYFTTLLGLTIVAEQGGSWYLRGYGDYESYCLKLTASSSPGLGHMAVRAWSPEALARRVAWLKDAGVPGGWVDPEAGKGPAYEFPDPDGHRIRVYYETSKYVPAAGDRPAMKSNHQRYRGVGANVRRLEHVNLMASDVRACREFCTDLRHSPARRPRGIGHRRLARPIRWRVVSAGTLGTPGSPRERPRSWR